MSSGRNKPPKSVSSSGDGQRKVKNNLNRRKTSVNSNLDETTLIGCFAYYCEITVRRSTKQTLSGYVERFLIENVSDSDIEAKVKQNISEFLNTHRQTQKKLENRTVQKIKQNLYFNFIIEYLIKNNNAIGFQSTKKATKTVKRDRFKTINGRTLEECRNFGKSLNDFLRSAIPVKGKKKETLFTVTNKMVEEILKTHPMSFPKDN